MDIQSLAKIMADNKIEIDVHVVEFNSRSLEPSYSHYDSVYRFLSSMSFASEKSIIYIGPSEKKAKLIHDTYLKAGIHANGIKDADFVVEE